MNETEGNFTDVPPVWADDYHPPKTAFIICPIILFLVGPLISACCVACTTNCNCFRKKEHEERQENEEDRDGEDGEANGANHPMELTTLPAMKITLPTRAKISDFIMFIMYNDDMKGFYKEAFHPNTAFTIVSISFLILGSVQMNFEKTFIVLVSFICLYGFAFGVCSVWGASHKDKNGEFGKKILIWDSARLPFHLPYPLPDPFDQNWEFEWKTKIWEFDEATVKVDNRFQDFGNNFTGTFLLGCSQITLMCLYILAVFEGGRPEFNERRVYIFYCLGSVIQVGYIVGKDLIMQLLFFNSKDHVFWARVLNYSRENEITYDWKDRWDNKLTQPEIWLRMLFSILINQVGMQLLLALLPLQLAGSTNPFDFVLNAVAAYFVIEMDDIDTKAYDRIDRANNEEMNGEELGLIRSGANTTAGNNVEAGPAPSNTFPDHILSNH